MNENYKLTAKDPLTELVKSKGISFWNELIDVTKNLAYGRNQNRTDLSLVLTEKKGTCSSKHAFLKKMADLNNIPNVKLILGIYKMNHLNTPKIGNELIKNTIDFIPEAHCYLQIENTRIDFTSKNANFQKIENDILEEKEIKPEQVAEFKIKYHQDFLKKWIEENHSKFNFNQIWQIREKCIKNITEANT